ncbi:hypothetical protein [Burkholderia sp. BCC1640]|uniref:WapI family immunity protein n=1 Tax=Burkholderia sp. BCC1640 TaxID=2676294 RepID=UPI00158D41FC|nr:hypothetical protein [Burkholderia sp. BCC1640]
MSTQPHVHLSEPSLQIASLKLWVHCRQFPLAQDYWDGNWLYVTARCDSGHSSVATRGSIVHLGELARLLDECERLYESLSGVAKLDCIEPNLSVTLTAQTVGHIDVQIDITPDHMLERHEFKESIDQSYLPAIISQCREILTEYPVRDPKMGAD